MANTITAAKAYLPLLDQLYKAESKTTNLDVPPALVRAGHNAGSFLLPTTTLVGLGNYDKADGYPAGDVTFAWKEYTYRYDRGRTFTVDAVDDMESLGLAFGSVAGEFMRVHVAPEIDALRFEKLYDACNDNGGTLVEAALSDADAWVSALNTMWTTLTNAEVPTENMRGYISAAGAVLLDNLARDATPTKMWQEIDWTVVPGNRFKSDVTLNAGASSDAGGYSNAGANPLNFAVVAAGSCFADTKHALPRIFSPEENQTVNAWKFDYRVYHDMFVYEQKENGIYVHANDTVTIS